MTSKEAAPEASGKQEKQSYEEHARQRAADEEAFVEKMRREAPPNNFEAWMKLRETRFQYGKDIIPIGRFREEYARYLNRLEETREHLILTRYGSLCTYVVHPDYLGKLWDAQIRFRELAMAVEEFNKRGGSAKSESATADHYLELLVTQGGAV